MSTSSIVKRTSSIRCLQPLLERFPAFARGVRAHHHGARGGIRRSRAGRRRRDHYAAAFAAQSKCPFFGRHPTALLLPADSEARARPRKRCSAPRPAAIRGFFWAPTVRRTNGPPRRMPAAAPACSPLTPPSSCTPRPSNRLGRLDRLEPFASHFGADFYGLPRHARARSPWSRSPGSPPKTYEFGNGALVPYRGRRADRLAPRRHSARHDADSRRSLSPRAFAAFCRW